MNLFLKGNSFPLIVSIRQFSNQLYIITQSRRVISNQYLFQRLNPSQVVLRINTCRAETFCYTLKRVVKANRSESIIRSSEIHSILIRKVKCEVHVIPEVKNYTTPIVCKNSLTDFSNVSNPTLVISKCSNIIPYKFKAVKFTLE